MSFNRNQFNHGRFNIVQTENVIMLSVEAFERVDCVTTSSQKIFLLCIPHERVGTYIHGTAVRHFTAQALEEIGWNISLNGTYWLDMQANELIHTETLYYAIRFIESLFQEKITHSAVIRWHRSLLVSVSESVSAFADRCSFYHIPAAEGGELVSQVSSADVVEEIVCLINTTLMPGQRLIIDANSYDVLIDGKNAIHTQQGEWLDELNRNTIDITVTAQSPNIKTLQDLSMSILYTERYL